MHMAPATICARNRFVLHHLHNTRLLENTRGLKTLLGSVPEAHWHVLHMDPRQYRYVLME